MMFVFNIKKKNNNDFIFIQVKKEDQNINSTYESLMKFEDFEKLESVFLKLYDTIPKLFEFIQSSFNEKIISIKSVSDSTLTLEIISKFIGFKDPISLELNLKKENGV